jgi:uncharacterized damage-inducible protein DinB
LTDVDATPLTALEPILAKLSRAQLGFLRAADAIPTENWKTCPRAGSWSAAELVAHVCIVERAIIATSGKILQKSPKRIPLLRRFHLPFILAESRIVRLKSPLPLDANLIGEKQPMLSELQRVRQETLQFIERIKERDLGAYRWRHPFLGSLNGYEWLLLVASHQIRHEKQMWEIGQCLPKAVGTLQK